MSIDPKQFRELIVRPTLKEIQMWSEAAEELLMLTAAQESHLGTYLHQVGGGPALGVYQMEPGTFAWLKEVHWRKLPIYALDTKVTADRLIWDLKFATVFARLRYRVEKEPLPDHTNLMELARYWDRLYNRNPNTGFPKDAVANYRRFVLEDSK